jgi:FAD/FMN-containing dehydrogenase
MSTTVGSGAPALETLGALITGDVVLPGQDEWETARRAWNLAVEQRPAAVVYPESPEDMVAIVGFAAEHDLSVAFNAGGHNAGPIPWGQATLLVKCERLRGVEIDPAARRARVESGVLANELGIAAAEHGLAYLAGTSPDVGIAGYALGGGMSWMARRHGFCANAILAVELVTADGRLVRADAEHEADLFWAVRGGSGNFGAVTAIELRLFPITELYAGALFWPIERAREILNAWREWIVDVPEECTSLGRLLQLPPIPDIPEHLRGRSFAMVEAALLGSREEGEALLAPLRSLGPEMDSFDMIPPTRLSEVNMDPDHPVPYHGDGLLLDDFPAEAVEAVIASFVGSPLMHFEVRQLGGAVGTSSPEHGALDRFDASFLSFVFGVAMDAEMGAAVERQNARVLESLSTWDSGRRYLNFVESRVDPAVFYSPESYERLRAIKSSVDPGWMFRANHAIPPASSGARPA